MTAITSAHIDKKKYSRLLAKTLPRAISTEEENERLLAIVEQLMSKGENNLSPEEDVLLELLVTLIERFEEDYYKLDRNTPASSIEVLRELMSARGLKPKDLWDLFGSKGLTSEVLSGKRGISKSKAKALAEFFHVSPDLFI